MSKKMVIGFQAILEPSVSILEIQQIKEKIEATEGIAAVEEVSVPVVIPTV